jgi:hypothetical protein
MFHATIDPHDTCELLDTCDLFVVSLSLIEKLMEDLRLIAKVSGSVRWDCTSLGEGMLRFDPSEDRIHTARTPGVSEGGGEFNVARGWRSGTHLTRICSGNLGFFLNIQKE